MDSSNQHITSASWAKPWLCAAGIYNLIWGSLAIAQPHLLFDLTGATRINYPEIWQCVGMIVGVYGVGYLIASRDPLTHWPIVLVGFLGKILGPIGFAIALLRGTFPLLFGITILTNDLIWLIPFGLILLEASKYSGGGINSSSSRSLFVKETLIDAPREIVFQFHESPDALAQLIPPWENVTVNEPPTSLLPGTRVVLKGRIGFAPIRWVAIHTEYDPPNMFADRQEAGPFKYWYHRHRFLTDESGHTVLRDEVEYELPFGRLGQVIVGRLIRHKLDRMFAYRHETTKRSIEDRKIGFHPHKLTKSSSTSP